MIFLTFLLIPAVILTACFWIFPKTICWTELIAQFAIQSVFTGLFIFFIHHQNTHDTSIKTGVVTNKHRDKVSCSHSYRCRCYTTCHKVGKSTSCTQHCSTCYEHSYDVDWVVDSNIRHRSYISRIDRQGLGQPPRWTQVIIGEPYSATESFTNYVKASPDSLFRYQSLTEKYKDKLPPYPNVYDYYRSDRLVTVGNVSVDRKQVEDSIDQLNADIGPSKDVHLLLVMVDSVDPDYYYALYQHWMGGKENDVIVVIGVKGTEIQWANVMSWTDQQYLKVVLRDKFLDLKTYQGPELIPLIREKVEKHYRKKDFKDFEYLASTVVPTTLQYVLGLILGILVSIGNVLWAHKNELHRGGRYV